MISASKKQEFNCGACLPADERLKLVSVQPYTPQDWHSETFKHPQTCGICGITQKAIFVRETGVA